jgi:hypothetical protein
LAIIYFFQKTKVFIRGQWAILLPEGEKVEYKRIKPVSMTGFHDSGSGGGI